MYFKYDDINLYYEKFGCGDEELVILPGWGNTKESWNYIINLLSDYYTIYIVDFPGFGNTIFPDYDLDIYFYTDMIKSWLEELNLKIDYALLLNVDYELALKRTLGRQICPQCKKTYNKLTGVNPPLVENMCNDCKCELTTRNDDNEETFNLGYNAYVKNCAPVIEYYREQGILVELDSSKDPEYTFKQFEELIGSNND